ncbi:MAG: CoA-binding protein [Syntrophaceae bacterium]|nr:CoA-binding protein [Syntrophaceae bacterium]
MDPRRLVEKAKNEGRSTLTEAESKQMLGCYGIPVVEEGAANTAEEAVLLGNKIGYPAVLKGLGAKLTHKTEKGLVHLNIRDEEELLAAARAVAGAAGNDLEGYLVQPMISGRREFVAGLFCDPQFGPVVMFGLGGIFTEALEDVVFRIAPISGGQAETMIEELHSSRLLRAFRGEAPARREEMIRTLVGLSRLGLELTDVTEVDINPLIVGADGRVTAVDALVVLGERPAPPAARPPVDVRDVFKFFVPESVAFVGASSQFGKWGEALYTNVLAGGYEGKIHLVNNRGGEIFGREVYRSIGEIPGKVDLAVVTIPAALVSGLIPEFQAKGVRHMLLTTSGFAEVGSEGKTLERDLVRKADEAGIVILGPNTMGLSSPHAKFNCVWAPYCPKPGSISMISQSGTMGALFLHFADEENYGIRAFSGTGNEAMITIEDYLSGFAQDDRTNTIVLFIESIKNGRRFFEEVSHVSRGKPVIILKGGRTEAGQRATASHTGALASNTRIFETACRQAGAVLARQPLDLFDLAAAFSFLPLPKGKRVAIMTMGGGMGVVATDACIESGLEIPPLPEHLISQINELLPDYWSRSNPVDMVAVSDLELPLRVLEVLASWDGCDAVFHLGTGERGLFGAKKAGIFKMAHPEAVPEWLEDSDRILDGIYEQFVTHTIELMKKYGKPILGVSMNGKIVTDIDGGNLKGISFPTPERAVRVLARMVEYGKWLSRAGNE